MKRFGRKTAIAAVVLMIVIVGIGRQANGADVLPTAATVDGDQIDAVFLDAKGPIFLRFHVQYDGVSFRKAWDRFAARSFELADRDKNGSLAYAEAQQAILTVGIPWSLDGGLLDEKTGITRDAWVAWLRQTGEAALVEQPAASDTATVYRLNWVTGGQPPKSDNELWQHLDANGDGSLTREEIAAARDRLRPFDLDDNEVIAASELRPYENGMSRFLLVNSLVSGSMYTSPPSAGPSIQLISSSGDNAVAVAERILARYDSKEYIAPRTFDAQGRQNVIDLPEGNLNVIGADDARRFDLTRTLVAADPIKPGLSRVEIGLTAEEFQRLDGNRDKLLDKDELTLMVKNARPEFALVVRLGADARRLGKFALPEGKVSGLPPTTRGTIHDNGDGTLTLRIGLLHLRFTAADAGSWDDQKRGLEQAFDSYDGDNNDYLDAKEAPGVVGPALFEQMDSDKNGMVFLDEMLDYHRERFAFGQSRLAVGGSDQGKQFFKLVDGNDDGRLSLRELAGLRTSLATWDVDRDHKLTEAEIPRQFTVNFGHGAATELGWTRLSFTTVVFNDGATANGGPPKPEAGPVWFRKMDRNRDGDVSPREFLGPAEHFRRLDANGDGLLDAAEAAKLGQ